MTRLDHIKTARSLMNYANQLATIIMTKANKNGIDFRSDEVQDQMAQRWKPAYERAWAYADTYNISKHQL